MEETQVPRKTLRHVLTAALAAMRAKSSKGSIEVAILSSGNSNKEIVLISNDGEEYTLCHAVVDPMGDRIFSGVAHPATLLDLIPLDGVEARLQALIDEI